MTKRIILSLIGLVALCGAAFAQTPQLVRECVGTAASCVPISAAAPLPVTAGSGGLGSVNQGNKGTNAQSWWMQIGDGTNGPVTVKPPSTAALATDSAAVTQLTPNSPGIVTLGPAADTAAIPFVMTPTGNQNSGIVPVVGGSAVSSLVLKGSPGSLYSVYAACTSACWLMVFNATAAPSNGGTTAGSSASNMVECVPIGAGSIGGVNYGMGPPAVYTTGITATISSTACATLTLSTVGFIHGMVK